MFSKKFFWARSFATISSALLFVALNAAFSNCHAQGSLTPPGPPGPTMLTLSQVEPRTPVDAVHTPAGGGAEFYITNSGSYYLTTNIIGISAEQGINISANDVTLDLNGFSLISVPGAYNGIYITNTCANITVRNGTIYGWGLINITGVDDNGVECHANNTRFENLIVSSNYNAGIYNTGNGAVIKDCLFSGNGVAGLEEIGSGSLIADNNFVTNIVANLGGSSLAIDGSNNRIEDNHITSSGQVGHGIYVFPSTSYTNNLLIRNSVYGYGANDYSFNTSQIVGPLITNTAAGIITNSNPWANFAF